MKKLYHKIYALTKDAGYGDIGLYAAAGTYYLFLSLAPLAALLLALVPHVGLSRDALLDTLLTYTPPAFQTLMDAIVSQVYTRSWTVVSLSFLLELWSAAKFLSSLLNGLGRIYGQSTRYKGFVRRRLAGAVCTLALVVFLAANAGLLLFGQRWLAGQTGHLALLLRLRGLFFSASLTAVLALLFSAGSGRCLPFVRQLPGAAGAAVGWLIFSRVYAWAAGRFGLFGIYGSLALLSVSLFWMYGSLCILLLGAWVNRALVKQ